MSSKPKDKKEMKKAEEKLPSELNVDFGKTSLQCIDLFHPTE